MPQSDPSRTEKATPKQKNKARDEGNVAKGEEVSKTLTVLIGVIALWLYMGYISSTMLGLVEWFMSESSHMRLTEETVYRLFVMCSISIAKMVVPILIALGLIAFISVRVQVGSLWTTKVFKPKISKFLKIHEGLKRMMFSMSTAQRTLKSLLQAAAIAVPPYIVLKQELENIVPLFYYNVDMLVYYMLITGMKMVIYALVPMIIIAIADTAYQFWDYEENLKMTKDEVKDERKQQEGDPQVKNEQKKKMMSVVMQRIQESVPKADVVITNPTHYAIALRYDATEAPAPVVVAKGVDYLAERIKELAREHGVPVRENKPLAQALYKMVEIGDMIPEAMYQAVASILAQLYKNKR